MYRAKNCFWPRAGRRDHGWRLIKAAWLENLSPHEDVVSFLAEFGPSGTLAAAYETSVLRGDELADRLRREADRVAREGRIVGPAQTIPDNAGRAFGRGTRARRAHGTPRAHGRR